jgi:hypothetical protein
VQPVVLLLESRIPGRAEAELRKRYGADYQLIRAGSDQDALEILGRLRDEQR